MKAVFVNNTREFTVTPYYFHKTICTQCKLPHCKNGGVLWTPTQQLRTQSGIIGFSNKTELQQVFLQLTLLIRTTEISLASDKSFYKRKGKCVGELHGKEMSGLLQLLILVYTSKSYYYSTIRKQQQIFIVKERYCKSIHFQDTTLKVFSTVSAWACDIQCCCCLVV